MNRILKNELVSPTMNTLKEDFLTKELFDWASKNFTVPGATLPPVNIKETSKEFKFELAAPGLKKENFKIEMKNNILSINAERKMQKEEKNASTSSSTQVMKSGIGSKKENYHRREFQYDTFSRRFTLPESANKEKIEAEYKDGILKVAVAKKVNTTNTTVKAKAITIR